MWQLCKGLPSAGYEPVSEGTFHRLKSQKALLGLNLVSNDAQRKEMEDERHGKEFLFVCFERTI